MTDTDRRPRPRAFRLAGDQTVTAKATAAAPADDDKRAAAEVIEAEYDAFAREAAELADGVTGDEAAVEAAQANGLLRRYVFSWGGVFMSALTGLLSLALTMWVWNFVEDLFTRSAILGTIGLTLARPRCRRGDHLDHARISRNRAAEPHRQAARGAGRSARRRRRQDRAHARRRTMRAL